MTHGKFSKQLEWFDAMMHTGDKHLKFKKKPLKIIAFYNIKLNLM